MEQGAHDESRDSEARTAADTTQPDRPMCEPEREKKQETKPATEREQEHMKAERPPSTRADIAQVIIQGILVFGALYGLFIYDGQLTEARRSNDLMQKSTEVATKAANAAEAGIRKAEESSRLDQRAWVAVNGIGGVPEAGKAVEVAVRLDNTGRTFAKNTRFYLTVEFREAVYGIPKDPPPNRKVKSVSLMVPNSPATVYAGREAKRIMTQEEMDLLQDGRALLFVRGKVTYDDIFGCGHWTTFCARLNPTSGNYEACDEQNDAGDDPCP